LIYQMGLPCISVLDKAQKEVPLPSKNHGVPCLQTILSMGKTVTVSQTEKFLGKLSQITHKISTLRLADSAYKEQPGQRGRGG
jgi:hypothetical protein